MKSIIELLQAIGDYRPLQKFDPFDEDCCGCHTLCTITNSGLGPSVRFSDGVSFYFSDDDGSLIQDPPKEL